MQLIDILKKKTEETFENARVAGTGKIAPRLGYYYIRNVTDREIGIHGQVPIANVNYKETLNCSFVEDAIFEIALLSIFSSRPDETQGLLKSDLIGKVIYVYDCKFVSKNINGEPKTILECKWHLVKEEPSFINNKNLLSHIVVPDTNSFEQIVAISQYDVLEAIDYEAQFGYNDGIVEGYAYENDDLIGELPFDGEDWDYQETEENNKSSLIINT